MSWADLACVHGVGMTAACLDCAIDIPDGDGGLHWRMMPAKVFESGQYLSPRTPRLDIHESPYTPQDWNA